MINDLRDNLRNIIKERSINQAALSRRLNMPPCIMSNILVKRRKMDATEMFEICDAIGITPEELRTYRGKQAMKCESDF